MATIESPKYSDGTSVTYIVQPDTTVYTPMAVSDVINNISESDTPFMTATAIVETVHRVAAEARAKEKKAEKVDAYDWCL
jgi:hypothetical protein